MLIDFLKCLLADLWRLSEGPAGRFVIIVFISLLGLFLYWVTPESVRIYVASLLWNESGEMSRGAELFFTFLWCSQTLFPVVVLLCFLYLGFEHIISEVRDGAGFFAISWRIGFLVLVWAFMVYIILYEVEGLRELLS